MYRVLSRIFSTGVPTKAAALAAALLLLGATSPALAGTDEGATPVIVFDLEVIDNSDPRYRGRPQPPELEIADTVVAWIREAIDAKEEYRLVDHGEALDAAVEKHVPKGQVGSCVECQVKIARELGAEEVFTGGVRKISNLILAADMEHYHVADERRIAGGNASLRSNNPHAWARTFSYLFRNTMDMEFPIPDPEDFD